MRRTAVVTFALMVLLLVAVGVGTWQYVQRPQSPVVQPPTPSPAPASTTILLQQADGNLALADSQGHVTAFTKDANGGQHVYGYAVPAPDGQSVAYVETLRAASSVSSSLVIQPLDGTPRRVFGSRALHPFYLHWSPDSAQLAFLSGDGADMQLQAVSVRGSAPMHIIDGQPSYFAWTPDSRRLLLHTKGEAPEGTLSLWNVGDAQPQRLRSAPAFFRAPAWLPDGRSALATLRDEAGVTLVRIGEDGVIQQRLAHAVGGIVFVPAPSGQQVAYIDTTQAAAGPLQLVDADGQHNQAITKQAVIAFLWSPDSKAVAYLTITKDGGPGGNSTVAYSAQKARVRWNVYNVAQRTVRTLPPFAPTSEFVSLLPFFDQYAQSIRLWDRAGRRLIYADDQGVWTVDVATGTPTRVGDGVLGVWMDR